MIDTGVEVDALAYVETELRVQRVRAARAVGRASALHELLILLADLAHHHSTTTIAVEDVLDAARSELERAQLRALLDRIDREDQ